MLGFLGFARIPTDLLRFLGFLGFARIPTDLLGFPRFARILRNRDDS